jgi:hypothetical protein
VYWHIESADLKAWVMPNFDLGHYFSQNLSAIIPLGRSPSEAALLSQVQKHDY